MAKKNLLRDPDGLWPTVLALGYILVTYVGGWIALFQESVGLFILGVAAITHGMTIAAYLMHDCGHNAIFLSTRHNTLLGKLLNFICGSDYGTYEDMRYKHMRHHVDNCEPLIFDYRSGLLRHPVLHRIVNALEWAYIPAVELIMHGMQLCAPFVYDSMRDQRARVIRVIAVRLLLLGLIAWYSPIALLGYVIAYLLFITILRFMDNFQHNYEIYYQLADADFVPPKKGDQAYEEANTYSNLLSHRWPWLNLLVLNFCYHNAHHLKPTLGWYKLPNLHQEMYPDGCPQTFSFWSQLVCFHKHRVARVLSEDYGSHDVVSDIQENKAVGVNALSFLTAF